MLIDTHCHVDAMVKKTFNISLTQDQILQAGTIIEQAARADVTILINVGTSLVESMNSVRLAQQYGNVYAAVGIHPNDCTENWRADLKQIELLLAEKEKNKIVAIGECGLDRHYENYNLPRQKDAFKAQIELALTHDLALVVHTRQAYDETLYALDEFRHNNLRGTIHCFSEDQTFADHVIEIGFVIGLGGTITYPKNNTLRSVATSTPLEKIVLETDAPFLPPQSMRGKQNHPQYIAIIAEYLAELRAQSMDVIAQQTTKNALQLFRIEYHVSL